MTPDMRAPAEVEDRCDLTELLVTECGCRRHRGGPDPTRAAGDTVGQAFDAAYPGTCQACEHPIEPGDRIARLADEPGYVHAVRCPR